MKIKKCKCCGIPLFAQTYERLGGVCSPCQTKKGPALVAVASCSFCGNLQTKVKTLIAGNGAYICDSCVEACQDILEKERKSAAR